MSWTAYSILRVCLIEGSTTLIMVSSDRMTHLIYLCVTSDSSAEYDLQGNLGNGQLIGGFSVRNEKHLWHLTDKHAKSYSSFLMRAHFLFGVENSCGDTHNSILVQIGVRGSKWCGLHEAVWEVCKEHEAQVGLLSLSLLYRWDTDISVHIHDIVYEDHSSIAFDRFFWESFLWQQSVVESIKSDDIDPIIHLESKDRTSANARILL